MANFSPTKSYIQKYAVLSQNVFADVSGCTGHNFQNQLQQYSRRHIAGHVERFKVVGKKGVVGHPVNPQREILRLCDEYVPGYPGRKSCSVRNTFGCSILLTSLTTLPRTAPSLGKLDVSL